MFGIPWKCGTMSGFEKAGIKLLKLNRDSKRLQTEEVQPRETMSKVKQMTKRKGKSKNSGCANPHCFNRSEKLPVACRQKCGFVFYCCENCEKQHWLTGHQFDCPLQSSFTPNNILSEREWKLFESTPFIKQGELLPTSKLFSLKKLTLKDFEAINPTEERSIATVVGEKMISAGAGVSAIGMTGEKKRTFLGQGSYGSVELVRYKKTGQMFAMKRLDKNSFANKMQKRSLLDEVQIHKRLVHDNIIRLYHSFQDEANIYLVSNEFNDFAQILEYAANGTLFHLIRRRKRLNEDDAFYYFIQACSGVYFLHENNMIHRDIKPENLLIDSNDKIKLCDFGWCVVNQETTTRSTYCGTLQYMAPQMLHNGEHNHTLDLWALGVLLYELLHGHAPFTGRAHLEVKKKIMKKDIKFRETLSNQVKDLILNLLQHQAKQRLPLMKVLIHPWVMNMSKKFKLIDSPDLNDVDTPSLGKQSSGDVFPKKKSSIADFYDLPPKKAKIDSDSSLLMLGRKKEENTVELEMKRPSKRHPDSLLKNDGSSNKKLEKVVDLFIEEESKQERGGGRESSSDNKIGMNFDKFSTGSKFSAGATTKATISKLSSVSNQQLNVLLSEREENGDGQTMEALQSAQSRERSNNSGSMSNRNELQNNKLQEACHELLDQINIFDKIRETRRESIRNSPKKVKHQSPVPETKIFLKSQNLGDNFSERAAISAMQSYRRQSTVVSRNNLVKEECSSNFEGPTGALQTDRMNSFIQQPGGYLNTADNMSVVSGKNSRRNSRTFIQIFEGTPSRRKPKKNEGDFGRSMTITKNQLLPPRPDRRKDSAPGSMPKRYLEKLNTQSSLQPIGTYQRMNIDSPSCLSSNGEYGVNHTFDNFSSDFDLTCQKTCEQKPLLRVNSPYDPVARKRIALRDFSVESRQDTQAIITPTQKRVQSNSQFKDESQVREEPRLAPKKPQTQPKDDFNGRSQAAQFDKQMFARSPAEERIVSDRPYEQRKREERAIEPSGFFEKIWNKINPFGSALTNRNEPSRL